MNKRTLCIHGCILLSIITISGNLLAHTTVRPKNTPDAFYQRSEPDGASSVVNDFVIPHGCNGASIVATAMVFPNGEHVVVEDQDGMLIEDEMLFNELEMQNNLVMSPKPAQDANWKLIDVVTGPTREFYSHGVRTEDVRGFHYTGGNLPNTLLGILSWRASFANIKDSSCVKAIDVRIPIVNYCGRNPNSPARMDAWVGRTTPVFNDSEVLVRSGWWPYLTITNTSFDETACGEGVTYKVSPTDEDIDTFLPIKSFKP
jgi:hypothetical protein